LPYKPNIEQFAVDVNQNRSKLCDVSYIDICYRLRHTGVVDRLYKQFGQRLRELRMEAGLTQEDVAERVKLRRTSITNIERGRQHIALHQLYLLASAVGTSPQDLLPDTQAANEELLPAEVDSLRAATDDEEDVAFATAILSKRQPQTGVTDE
jgi:transcriptional regulator with XRE-family HTH domain